ncbi:MAG: TonB family protein [Deltaproteobacteria bacterium]|nr:MAG: TonB family protein [Deltaproteobacteria bacterium]TMA75314.1 MAG: TonB family protein [Deltaproteobacteria bacterium]
MRRAALAFVLSIGTAMAAQTPMAVLTGVVVDADTQAPVSEAVVIARSPSLVGEQSAITDESGAFEITWLPAGTYSLAVRRDGFEPYAPETLAIKGGKVRVRISVAPVPTPAAILEKAVEFEEQMTAPEMISGPAPEYTPEAIERGIEGSMQVRCVVTAEGQVRTCKVVKGLPFMNTAVIGALERRKYKPAAAHGKPVDVYYTFNIRLKLPSR